MRVPVAQSSASRSTAEPAPARMPISEPKNSQRARYGSMTTCSGGANFFFMMTRFEELKPGRQDAVWTRAYNFPVQERVGIISRRDRRLREVCHLRKPVIVPKGERRGNPR
uniref:Uncharacterized protein n=1 Tax=Ralstonia solanacearum CFBP2957 TaxID=859656 RepID=D8P4M6_RALSL|nr:protein of unknown function [Ralstonia solanacearum CFBP2957]